MIKIVLFSGHARNKNSKKELFQFKNSFFKLLYVVDFIFSCFIYSGEYTFFFLSMKLRIGRDAEMFLKKLVFSVVKVS